MTRGVNEEDPLLEMHVIFGELKVFEIFFITYHIVTLAAAVILLRGFLWSFEDSRASLEEEQYSLVLGEAMAQKLAKSTLQSYQLFGVKLFLDQIDTFLNDLSLFPLFFARHQTNTRPID